jgi:hypothetical protein
MRSSAAASRPFGDNLMPCTATQLWSTQHVFPGADRSLEDFRADLALQGMIGARVPGVRHAPIPVSQVLGQSIQACAIAKRCEPCERFARLERSQ